MLQRIIDANTTIAETIRRKKRISRLLKQHVEPSTKVVFVASVRSPKQFDNIRHKHLQREENM
jgi:hypothetical protein